MFTGRTPESSIVANCGYMKRRDSALSALNEAALTLQAMDDIFIDPNQALAVDSTIDPVPLQRIFRHEEPWARKSAP